MKQNGISLSDLKESIHEDIKTQLKPLDEKLDWLVGKYKKFDEEQTLLSERVSNYDDRIEHIEQALGIIT